MADKVWPSKEPRMPVAVREAGPAPSLRALRAAGRQAERSRRWLSQPRSMGQRQTDRTAGGGMGEREREEVSGEGEARPNRTTCTHAHATTSGEGRGGNGLAQPASSPIPPRYRQEEKRPPRKGSSKENLWHSPVWLLGLSGLYHLHSRQPGGRQARMPVTGYQPTGPD